MLSNKQKYTVAQMVVNKTLSHQQACKKYGILKSSLQYYCKRVRVDTEVLNHPGRHRIIDSIRDKSIKSNSNITELTLEKFIRQAAKETYHARHNSELNTKKLRKNHKYLSRRTLCRYIALYTPYCQPKSCVLH